MQLRTSQEFSEAITSDLTWRIKEISDLRTAVRRLDRSFWYVATRAGVPLIYAHWEGHISFVSKAYMEFISIRRLRYSELKPGFLLNKYYNEFVRLGRKELGYKEMVQLLENILHSGNLKLGKVDERVVSTRSNLKSDVLRDVLATLCLDGTMFEDEVGFIDKVLIPRRNSIAHGENTSIDFDAFLVMSDRVISLMRQFNNLVDNEASCGGYRLAG